MRGQGKVPKVKKSSSLQHHNPQEREEIREYLARLRQIVPGCPKDGKLSRLELIQHVIDYIVQLQDTLLCHPINRLLGPPPDEEDRTSDSPSLPATPPGSPMVDVLVQQSTTATTTISRNHPINNNGCSYHPGLVSVSPPSRSQKGRSASSSSCRRPLGVLSSLNQHRSM